MKKSADDIVEAIKWNKELFDDFGEEFEFDKELEFRLEHCEEEEGEDE